MPDRINRERHGNGAPNGLPKGSPGNAPSMYSSVTRRPQAVLTAVAVVVSLGEALRKLFAAPTGSQPAR